MANYTGRAQSLHVRRDKLVSIIVHVHMYNNYNVHVQHVYIAVFLEIGKTNDCLIAGNFCSRDACLHGDLLFPP